MAKVKKMFRFSKNREKVFCIGLNKTGTTTIEQVYKELGYRVGRQRKGELLIEGWGKRNFSKLITFCRTADAFQDVPFSLPYTFVILDQHFKNAKFILTVRNNEEQWYQSITRFQSKLWAAGDGIPPTAEQLKSATYIYEGRPFVANQLQFDTPPNEPYNKAALTQYYKSHNYIVQEYFRHRPEKLVKINVANDDDYLRLCHFLNKKPVGQKFPWLNKSG